MMLLYSVPGVTRSCMKSLSLIFPRSSLTTGGGKEIYPKKGIFSHFFFILPRISSLYTHELDIFPRLFESLPPPAQSPLHVLISFDLAGQTVLRQREVSQHLQVGHHPGPGLAVHLLSSQPGLLCLHLVESFLLVRVLVVEALVLSSQLRHLRR